MAEQPTFADFSFRGDPAKVKIAVLGPAAPSGVGYLRSLNIEHVSPAHLVRPEISRPTQDAVSPRSLAQKENILSEQITIGAMRRWFWMRKPDAGFILHNFPATLLQAKLLDEWLEARGENLTAVVVFPSAPADVVEYYHTVGCEVIAAATAA